MMLVSPHTHFHRSSISDATEPPEAHGIPRDAVKLLVAQPSGISHTRFVNIGDYLRAGDLVVVNNSATLPPRSTAAVLGIRSPSISLWLARPRSGSSNCDRPC